MNKMLRTLILSFLFLSSFPAFSDCEMYWVNISSDLANGGPSEVTWQLEDENGILFSDVAYFDESTTLYTYDVCLDPANFALTVTSSIPLMEGGFDASLQFLGGNVYPTNELIY